MAFQDLGMFATSMELEEDLRQVGASDKTIDEAIREWDEQKL